MRGALVDNSLHRDLEVLAATDVQVTVAVDRVLVAGLGEVVGLADAEPLPVRAVPESDARPPDVGL